MSSSTWDIENECRFSVRQEVQSKRRSGDSCTSITILSAYKIPHIIPFGNDATNDTNSIPDRLYAKRARPAQYKRWM
jgi:hypothetical protein